jgi:mediator of RNA polymerase II transcription subunit 5
MHRIDAAEFRDLSKLLRARCPIGDSSLIDLLLQTRLSTGVKWDPLLPLYIDCLCKRGGVQISTVLASLLRHSSILDKPSPGADVAAIKKRAKCYTLMTDIKVIQDAMLSISTGATVKSLLEAIQVFSATADWIQAIIAWHNSHLDADQPVGLMASPDAVLLYESLGFLLAALSGTQRGLEVLSSHSHDGTFSAFFFVRALLIVCSAQGQDWTGSFSLPATLRRGLACSPQSLGQRAKGVQPVRPAAVQVGSQHDGQRQCQRA